MVDYGKWDNLELSDDSDIEAHPNVDNRYFIRAKQNQIHVEREQRKRQVKALEYERIINETPSKRVSSLVSAMKTHTPGKPPPGSANGQFHNPAILYRYRSLPPASTSH